MISAAAKHPTPGLRILAGQTQPTLQTGLVPGNSDPVGYWLTPPDLLGYLERTFGAFDFDACPFPRPAGWDGLKETWGQPGDKVWVNPPFVGPNRSRTAWFRQARKMQEAGRHVVMINAFDRWVVEFIKAGGKFHVPPDFDWLDPDGKPQKTGRPHLIMELPPIAGSSDDEPACFDCDDTGSVLDNDGNTTDEDCPRCDLDAVRDDEPVDAGGPDA